MIVVTKSREAGVVLRKVLLIQRKEQERKEHALMLKLDNIYEWEADVGELLKERNRVQTLPFRGIYTSHVALVKKHTRLQHKHTEIRNLVAILQYEIQDAINHDKTETLLDDIKSKLSSIQEDLSSRSTKDYDDIKIRIDLNKTIKTQSHLIKDLKEETSTIKAELAEAHENIVTLTEELDTKNKIIATLQEEVESLRAKYQEADDIARHLRQENEAFAERLMQQKDSNIQAMNEMNDMLQIASVSQKVIGGGLKFMQKLGVPNPFSAARRPSASVADDDDEFVEVPAARKPSLIQEVRPPRSALNTISCSTSEVNDVAYNKQVIIAGCASSSLNVYDATTKESTMTLMCGGPVVAVDLTDDYILAACSDNCCRVWSLATGVIKHMLCGHANKVTCAKFVGFEGKRALTGSADRSVILWDLSGTVANKIYTMKVPSIVDSVGVSPNFTLAASGHQDGGLRFWDLSTGQLIYTIPKLHLKHITSITFDIRNGNTVLCSSKDNTMSLVDTRTYEILQVYRAPNFTIAKEWSKAAYSPDCTMVAAGSVDGNIYVWDAVNGNLMFSAPSKAGSITSVFWGSTGVLSCGKEGGMTFWG